MVVNIQDHVFGISHELCDFLYTYLWYFIAEIGAVVVPEDYGINLNEADLHWWEFMGMLWNMPERQSSLQSKKKEKQFMSELTIIENELVAVYETSTGEKVVYGS